MTGRQQQGQKPSISKSTRWHHLQKVNEILGARLNTLHNLHFYQQLMRELRAAIAGGNLSEYAANFREDRRKLGKSA